MPRYADGEQAPGAVGVLRDAQQPASAHHVREPGPGIGSADPQICFPAHEHSISETDPGPWPGKVQAPRRAAGSHPPHPTADDPPVRQLLWARLMEFWAAHQRGALACWR